ncbi:MAG: hypothetical protein VX598_10150 [Verrucomicrobiota bacterium]|jgi:hypothetical protein|nr:hypothetical protein [Verrucomicrobiota bacterium]
MRLLLLSLLLLPLAKSAAEIAIFNEINERRVMIITGAGGEEEYTELFAEWGGGLAKAFDGNAAEMVHITNKPEDTGARKTVESTLNKWVENPDVEIWILLVGHGTFDGKVAKFNLVGNDASDADFKHWLKPHRGPLVFINTSSCSAPFIRSLSGPNRVVATATKSGYEQNFCRFGGYMAAALGQAEADLDKDGAVSVLEAFLIASRQAGEFYRENDRLVSENALLDDNGDGMGTPADWFRGVRTQKKAKGKSSADGKLSRLVFPVIPPAEKDIPAPLRKKRLAIEAKIETLRSLKKTLEAEIYYRDLEKLFLELAATNDEIETAQQE